MIKKQESGDYLGVEVGADVSIDVCLDDYMVFENNEDRSTKFFKKLLYEHICATEVFEKGWAPDDPDAMVRKGFSRDKTFRELVRAAEGVPRDAMKIVSHAAQEAIKKNITTEDIRKAAYKCFHRDKEQSITKEAQDLLHWIIDRVIAERDARAFLLENNVSDELIDELFDNRVIHLVHRNKSTHDKPGRRYDVYKIDYGCYVELITTSKAPQQFLPGLDVVDEQIVDKKDPEDVVVPEDDYRSIRRAILDLDEFYKSSA
jgi:hypothetical protein